mgnify:CR=1 FL=1
MKKTYVIEDLDCAHCAAKIEEAIAAIDGVESANVNFLAGKLIISAPDELQDSIIKEAIKLAAKIEPECRIVV